MLAHGVSRGSPYAHYNQAPQGAIHPSPHEATGKKAERLGLRLIPKGKFEELSSVAQVVERLFGQELKHTRDRQKA
jgi:hypothetical protein